MQNIREFLAFLDNAPSCYHAIDNCRKKLTENGYTELCETVATLIGTKDFDTSAAMLANERQRLCCENAVASLKEALDAVDFGLTLDAIGVCIDGAIAALLELTGQKASEAVVDEVFRQFCVGK